MSSGRERLTPGYRWIMAILRAWSLLLWPLRVEGREHLPEVGGALLVANHSSVLDITGMALASLPRHASFVARRSLSDSRFLERVLDTSEAILIEPGASDRAALRQIVERLREGRLVAIFPEGTRSPDGALHPFKGGALLAARMAGVPLIPCGVSGAWEAWPRHRRWPRRGPVLVRFGAPLEPDLEDLGEVLEHQVSQLAGIERAPSGEDASPPS
ncbi:MAG: lysophospholipid acyltransferase family protein [Planctomycetota bacterium]|nr:lysophospholipid acyltransferase family protein [Planctomycetota bacterium]